MVPDFMGKVMMNQWIWMCVACSPWVRIFLVSEEGLAAGETQTLFASANRFDDPCCIILNMYIYNI